MPISQMREQEAKWLSSRTGTSTQPSDGEGLIVARKSALVPWHQSLPQGLIDPRSSASSYGRLILNPNILVLGVSSFLD